MAAAALVGGVALGGTFYYLWQQSGPERRLQELTAFVAMYSVPVLGGALLVNSLQAHGRLSRGVLAVAAVSTALLGMGWCVLIYIQGCQIGWTECP